MSDSGALPKINPIPISGSFWVNGRDIYEVANQLEGYVDEGTPERLARFLLREGKAASDLADEIVRLRAEVERLNHEVAFNKAAVATLSSDCGASRHLFHEASIEAVAYKARVSGLEAVLNHVCDIAIGRDVLDGFPRGRDEIQRRLAKIYEIALAALASTDDEKKTAT